MPRFVLPSVTLRCAYVHTRELSPRRAFKVRNHERITLAIPHTEPFTTSHRGWTGRHPGVGRRSSAAQVPLYQAPTARQTSLRENSPTRGRASLRPTVPLQSSYMADPISVRLPEALLEALDDRVKEDARAPLAPDTNRSAVIQQALRVYLGFESSDAPDLFANQEAIQDAVNDHEDRLSKIERLAERTGAL